MKIKKLEWTILEGGTLSACFFPLDGFVYRISEFEEEGKYFCSLIDTYGMNEDSFMQEHFELSIDFAKEYCQEHFEEAIIKSLE